MANILPPHYSFMDCQHPPNSSLSSSTSTQIDTARIATIQGLMQHHFPTSVQLDNEAKEAGQWKVPDTRMHPIPIPPPSTSVARRLPISTESYTHPLHPTPTLSRTKVLVRDGPIQSHLVTREISAGHVPLVSLQV